MSRLMETQNYCPHFDFHPEDYPGFSLIPFQGKVECSEHCVNFASFLAQEATGYPYLPPPSRQLQDWVRRSLQAYAPLFTRTITTIPAELIPLGSHISNIDMQIEGRLTAIDLQKDEATFKLDKTSAKKLEVFHTELTGRESDIELTQKLSELEVKMAMVGVVGYNLLGFREVFGGLFHIDDRNTSVSNEELQHQRDPLHDIKDEWASFCQSFYEQQEGRFSPTQYETDYDDWGSLQVAVGDYSDDDQLETFPEDGSASPQDYWASALPQLHIVEGAVEPPSQFDFHCSPLQVRRCEAPSTITSPKTSFSQSHRGTPKAYGGLVYKRPLRVLRIPPTPSLVSCVDISSPPLFSLPDPVYPRSTLSDRESQRKASNSSLSLRTNISAIATHGSVAGSEQGTTPPMYSRTSSVDSTSEVTTSSSASTHSHPSIYDAFPTTLLASDSISQASDPIVFSPCSSIWEVGANGLQWNGLEKRHTSNLQKLPTIGGREMETMQGIDLIDAGDESHSGHPMAIETEDLDEYGFELEEESEFAPLQTKIEKEQDPTTVIIQGKVEAMLDAAQSQGLVYKATRDGLDNHPISVRLRSISGNHSSMKEILGERRCSFAANDNVAEARAMELTENQATELESSSFAVRGADSTPDDYQSSMTSGHYFGGRKSSTLLSDAPSLKSYRDMGQAQSRNQNFSEYKAGVRSATDRLRELKLKFEREGEQILGSYYRTLRRIQILETEILKSESLDQRTLESKAREMIEFCGYDESAFTEEGSLGNFPQKSKNYVGDYTAHVDLQNSNVSGGEGRVGPDAGIIDGAHSKADCARPLKVRTKFCANYTNPKETSPCCHFGKRSKGACPEELNIRCAHGMMREVKQISNSSSTITSPSGGGADLWRLNYTLGGLRGRAVRAYQEDCADCKSKTQCEVSEGGEPDKPRRSFSGTDVPKPVEKWLPISYPLTPIICSPESWAIRSPVEMDTAVKKDYYEKLTEYYKSAHGETIQRDGRASYETINPSTKENFGTGYEMTGRNY